jgi:glyoxylase-like metal-dependent hydrolase (beta-lactamase superfamily II)
MTHLTWTVGDVTITRIPEIAFEIPLVCLTPEGTMDALAPHLGWLEPYFMQADGTATLSIHGLVIDTGELRILVDTCIGRHPVPGYEAISEWAEDFLAGLADAGCARDEIDVVLCTHMHFDHVGWNTMPDGDRLVPTFPNARYLFGRAEWEHWTSTPDQSSYAPTVEAAVRPIVAAGLAELVESDHEICGSVRLVPTAGHTPGHVSVEVTSRGERAFITGDITHHPVQWAEPDWTMPADSDSAAAAATRRRMADALADSSTLVIGTHYAPPCAGHLVRGDQGVWFRAQA